MGTKIEIQTKKGPSPSAKAIITAKKRLGDINNASYQVALAKERLTRDGNGLKKVVAMGETAIKNGLATTKKAKDVGATKAIENIRDAMQRNAADTDGHFAKKAKQALADRKARDKKAKKEKDKPNKKKS